MVVIFPNFALQPFLLAAASNANYFALSVSEPTLVSVSTPADSVRAGDDIAVATTVRNNDEINERRTRDNCGGR